MGEKVMGLISKRSPGEPEKAALRAAKPSLTAFPGPLAHLAGFEMSDGWKVELE